MRCAKTLFFERFTEMKHEASGFVSLFVHGGTMKQKKATVDWNMGHINWYDPHSGKGSIIGDDGIWYRINEFSDIQINKHSALREKSRVEFILAKDSVHPIIKSVRKVAESAKGPKRNEKPRQNQKTRSI